MTIIRRVVDSQHRCPIINHASKEATFMMEVADLAAKQSNDHKIKVGAVIAKDRNILAYGYNGTASGTSNIMRDENDKTLPTVIHAEQNAIAKLAKSTQSGVGATLYCTHLPCMTCALSVIQAGIERVYFRTNYKDLQALKLFNQCGVEVFQVT